MDYVKHNGRTGSRFFGAQTGGAGVAGCSFRVQVFTTGAVEGFVKKLVK